MKKFVLITKSESSDYYTYLLKHHTKPTDAEIQKFLSVHAYDKDDEGYVYEHEILLTEIKDSDFKPIA